MMPCIAAPRLRAVGPGVRGFRCAAPPAIHRSSLRDCKRDAVGIRDGELSSASAAVRSATHSHPADVSEANVPEPIESLEGQRDKLLNRLLDSEGAHDCRPIAVH